MRPIRSATAFSRLSCLPLPAIPWRRFCSAASRTSRSSAGVHKRPRGMTGDNTRSHLRSGQPSCREMSRERPEHAGVTERLPPGPKTDCVRRCRSSTAPCTHLRHVGVVYCVVIWLFLTPTTVSTRVVSSDCVTRLAVKRHLELIPSEQGPRVMIRSRTNGTHRPTSGESHYDEDLARRHPAAAGALCRTN